MTLFSASSANLLGATLSLLAPLGAHAQATMDPVDMPPLMPSVTCVEARCDITFSGVFDGQTLTSEALSMQIPAEEGDDWQPRIMSNEAIKMEGFKAPYGWLIGEEEKLMEIYLTSLADPCDDSYKPGLFMIEQRAGFEHVGIAYHFFTPSYDRTTLATARIIPPSMGPQKQVTSANSTGVRVESQIYDPETGGFKPSYEQFEWYSGAESEMLGSEAEMEEINQEMDILTNEYILGE